MSKIFIGMLLLLLFIIFYRPRRPQEERTIDGSNLQLFNIRGGEGWVDQGDGGFF